VSDYSYPGIYFSYFLFFMFAVGAVFFFVRSLKDGYMGEDSEEPKYRMLLDNSEDDQPETPRRTS
jgi:hypothetical protein